MMFSTRSLSFVGALSLVIGCGTGAYEPTGTRPNVQPEADAGTPTNDRPASMPPVCGGADLANDRNNCGTCGHACNAGMVCGGGICMSPCTVSQQLCGGACVNALTDVNNCGACGSRCGAGMACTNGACVTQCPAGQSLCGSTCVDFQSDRNNCGACGNACVGTEVCVNGRRSVPAPVCASRNTVDIVLPAAFHRMCPGGMQVVVQGGNPAEDVRITSDGFRNPAYGVARYYGAKGQALSLSVAAGLWSGRMIGVSGYCLETDTWLESGNVHAWASYASAGAAGAQILVDGVNIASSSCPVSTASMGMSAYPWCTVPVYSCR